jgi:hypothetical protein
MVLNAAAVDAVIRAPSPSQRTLADPAALSW